MGSHKGTDLIIPGKYLYLFQSMCPHYALQNDNVAGSEQCELHFVTHNHVIMVNIIASIISLPSQLIIRCPISLLYKQGKPETSSKNNS